MNTFIDFEDRTVEKAIEKACSNLGVTKDKLRYDIISHGSSGIFGLVGAKKALIRVVLPESEKEPEQKADQVENSSPSSSAEAEDDSNVTALVNEAFGPTIEDEKKENDSEWAPPREPLPDIDPEKKAAVNTWVVGFLNKVVELISPDSEVQIHEDSSVCRFQITGGDSARLIGKKGQTLDAIQYLVEKGVNKQFGNNLTIEIDVEDYLEKRRTEITALAARLAEKAEQTGKPMVINRINAQDRRFVHMSLRENRNVRTQSVGNGDFRKLLILPKKKSRVKKTRSKEAKK